MFSNDEILALSLSRNTEQQISTGLRYPPRIDGDINSDQWSGCDEFIVRVSGFTPDTQIIMINDITSATGDITFAPMSFNEGKVRVNNSLSSQARYLIYVTNENGSSREWGDTYFYPIPPGVTTNWFDLRASDFYDNLIMISTLNQDTTQDDFTSAGITYDATNGLSRVNDTSNDYPYFVRFDDIVINTDTVFRHEYINFFWSGNYPVKFGVIDLNTIDWTKDLVKQNAFYVILENRNYLKGELATGNKNYESRVVIDGNWTDTYIHTIIERKRDSDGSLYFLVRHYGSPDLNYDWNRAEFDLNLVDSYRVEARGNLGRCNPVLELKKGSLTTFLGVKWS